MNNTERAIYKRFIKASLKAVDKRTHRIEPKIQEANVEALDEERATIVSIRVDMSRTIVENSTVADCVTCRAAVWLAKSSRDLLARYPKIRVVCIQCATVELERGGPNVPV